MDLIMLSPPAASAGKNFTTLGFKPGLTMNFAPAFMA